MKLDIIVGFACMCKHASRTTPKLGTMASIACVQKNHSAVVVVVVVVFLIQI